MLYNYDDRDVYFLPIKYVLGTYLYCMYRIRLFEYDQASTSNII